MPGERPLQTSQFTVPPPEPTATKEQRFHHVLAAGRIEALSVIKKSFENPLNPDNQLTYHGVTHTNGVVARTGRILRAIHTADSDLVTEKDIALGQFAAAWHDTVQEWQPNHTPDAQGREMIKRRRALRANEQASANLALTYLRTANEQLGEELFSKNDMRVVREAIMLTVPNFDVELGTVTQPTFGEYRANLVAQAVALADLGGGGMEGEKTARWETDSLFVEDNLDFGRLFSGPLEKIAEDDKAWYTERMQGWVGSQIRFSQGRAAQLEEEIATMDERAQRPVRELFASYPQTFTGMQEFLERRCEMDFTAWVEDMRTSFQQPPVYV